MGDHGDLSTLGFAPKPSRNVEDTMEVKCDQGSSATASTCGTSPTNALFNHQSDHAASEASGERAATPSSTATRWSAERRKSPTNSLFDRQSDRNASEVSHERASSPSLAAMPRHGLPHAKYDDAPFHASSCWWSDHASSDDAGRCVSARPSTATRWRRTTEGWRIDSPKGDSLDQQSDSAESDTSGDRVSPSPIVMRWRVPPHGENDKNDDGVRPPRSSAAPGSEYAAPAMDGDLMTLDRNADPECCVCLDAPAHPQCVLPCGHVCVCASCARTLASTRSWSKCPYCRMPFKRGDHGYVRAPDSYVAFIIRDRLLVVRVGAELDAIGLHATI